MHWVKVFVFNKKTIKSEICDTNSHSHRESTTLFTFPCDCRRSLFAVTLLSVKQLKSKAMKTKFTFIAFLTLLILSPSVHANQTFVDIWKRYFVKANEISVVNGIRSFYFEFPKYAAGANSVPGYSENYSWNTNINDWKHISNSTFTCDEAGRITEENVQDVQTNIYYNQYSYAYDYYGNVTEDVSYTRVIDEWELLIGKKSEYLYSVNGEITGVIEQAVENKAWVNKTKTEYILNSFSVPVGMQTFNWNRTGWESYSKTTDIAWKNWQKRELAAYTLMLWQNDTWVNSERYATQFNGDSYIQQLNCGLMLNG